ncbi:aminodeoxychorismate synthase component I [Pseudoteredinibacter isoporae]|uniref:aminodeoxychorismate synthase n=1 Tax=Pseudoteredinibacter isoporae TaxID=570281 RepID=A0A7X0JXB1_9GAMM|nr:aminodeoxychorismate synthase component I [Pseudoteredinibacter isoporae]MBB6523225.1 para-aminobenzoate synthetase component 1 [Pseudoteredinibacter isoporae]NHO88741.1 aminodeoxychorismate synthase component I [Pseudoteredinibacter isoporae]NIB22568.1 aminodeoxychorismate synthase component I [Pseudoteredinibacter isoporae]
MLCFDLPYFPDSAELFKRISGLNDAVWLDSCCHGERSGRYDIMSALPLRKLIHENGTSFICEEGDKREFHGDFFELLDQQIQSLPSECANNHIFCGGLIGYISYDFGMQLPFNKVTASPNKLPLADAQLGLYSWALVQDHHSQRSWCLGPDIGPEQHTIIADIVARCQCPPQPETLEEGYRCDPFRAQINAEEYAQKIDRIQDYIQAGDCYQVNFAQKFSAHFQGSALSAYLKLRQALPSPFSAFMQLDKGAILSHSPERFIRVQGDQVETKPIKGTIPRGHDSESDRQLARELQGSEKDRAENLMIVDLLRNDLSRNCKLGSVRVPELFALESYPNVHHLVSTITGSLTDDASALELLRDSFPGGSITGAPKKRAMEIIAELEQDARSVYCGSMVYISANGNMDSSITIRTLVDDGEGQVHCWGGGGITADSNSHSEYQESLTKVMKLLTTLENNAP